MKNLEIRIQPVNEEIMTNLESKNLIRRLLPTQKIITTPENEVGVETFYTTDHKFGPHMVICVGFNKSVVDMAYHSDNEDFICINEGRKQKPLVLVIALEKVQEFQKLISAGQLTENHILALELKFNDPRLSFFTMHGFTPHCEWTPPGDDPANVFYVAEPHDLDANHISLGDYWIEVKY